jgi:hypothetical protein
MGVVLLRQCCVCKKIYRYGKWVIEEHVDIRKTQVTHSFCDICIKIEYKKIKIFFDKENNNV